VIQRRRAKTQPQLRKEQPLWLPRTEAPYKPEDAYDYLHNDIHQEREDDAAAAAAAREKERDEVRDSAALCDVGGVPRQKPSPCPCCCAWACVRADGAARV
jgi:hypothetical protein